MSERLSSERRNVIPPDRAPVGMKVTLDRELHPEMLNKPKYYHVGETMYASPTWRCLRLVCISGWISRSSVTFIPTRAGAGAGPGSAKGSHGRGIVAPDSFFEDIQLVLCPLCAHDRVNVLRHSFGLVDILHQSPVLREVCGHPRDLYVRGTVGQLVDVEPHLQCL